LRQIAGHCRIGVEAVIVIGCRAARSTARSGRAQAVQNPDDPESKGNAEEQPDKAQAQDGRAQADPPCLVDRSAADIEEVDKQASEIDDGKQRPDYTEYGLEGCYAGPPAPLGPW
jgi:hypothetical protein